VLVAHPGFVSNGLDGLHSDMALLASRKQSIEVFGETPIQLEFNGAVKDEPGRKNPTLWTISGSGPYYAVLVIGGTLDTKGGPRANPNGQVLDDLGQPIPGLYALGNCSASVSAVAYWSGGATIGPIMAFAYRAANRAHQEPSARL